MGSCSDTDIDPGSVPKQNRCNHGLLSTFRRTLQLFKWTILNVNVKKWCPENSEFKVSRKQKSFQKSDKTYEKIS